jgi:signal transduction histidine kinase
LTSSKAEDGRLANYPVVVEVGEIVEQVAEAARFNAKSKGLALRYIVSGDQQRSAGQVMRPLYYTYVDPNRLREVLQNIIDNAIKYTSEGSVTIRLTGDPSVIQIQVADSGPGIPAEDVPHLFQKFYRVDNSMTRTTSGTGLGLFISRRIIEMNNGRIWAESVVGKGSTFFINLPRLTTEKALDIQKNQAAQISPLNPNQSPLP